MKSIFPFLDKVKTRKALLFSMIDGILWAIMFGFAENYIVPLALFFNATAFQTSIMQGSTQLAISISQLIGSKIVHKIKKRQLISVVCVAFHALTFILIPVVAIITKNPLPIMILFVGGAFITNIGGPGWVSWMNDIVPPRIRGTFWGIRSRILNLTEFCAIIVAGIILYIADGHHILFFAYAALFIVGGLSRLFGTIPLSKQYEPPMSIAKAGTDVSFGTFLSKLTTTNFGRFSLFSVILTFAVNVMSPVIPVFLLSSIGFNYLQYSIVMMSSMVSTFLAMSYWGKLADKYGNYRILLITAVSLPIVAIGWAFIKDFYLLILLQLFSGFVWAGFNLANQNYIFDSIKPENVTRISAYFISLNNIAAFAGSISGGILTLVTKLFVIPFFAANNYELIFFLSGLLRFVIIFFLIKRFTEVRSVVPSPGLRHFYIQFPMSTIYNRLVVSIDRLQGKGPRPPDEGTKTEK
jgi:MFS family permease